MRRLLIDQDLDHDIPRALMRSVPRLGALTAFEVGLAGASDPQLLTWVALEGRVVVSQTLPVSNFPGRTVSARRSAEVRPSAALTAKAVGAPRQSQSQPMRSEAGSTVMLKARL